MSDSEILDKAFPFGDDEPDKLLGLTDTTDGDTERYFSKLSDSDREIVQWYAEQGIRPTPYILEQYAVDLVTGYHMVDEHRRSELGRVAAQQEMKRIIRYAQLFIESEDFFPAIDVFGRKELDEDGSYYDVTFRAWACIRATGGALERTWQRLSVEEQVMPILVRANNFLEDPESEPDLLSIVEDVIKNEITD